MGGRLGLGGFQDGRGDTPPIGPPARDGCDTWIVWVWGWDGALPGEVPVEVSDLGLGVGGCVCVGRAPPHSTRGPSSSERAGWSDGDMLMTVTRGEGWMGGWAKANNDRRIAACLAMSWRGGGG